MEHINVKRNKLTIDNDDQLEDDFVLVSHDVKPKATGQTQMKACNSSQSKNKQSQLQPINAKQHLQKKAIQEPHQNKDISTQSDFVPYEQAIRMRMDTFFREITADGTNHVAFLLPHEKDLEHYRRLYPGYKVGSIWSFEEQEVGILIVPLPESYAGIIELPDWAYQVASKARIEVHFFGLERVYREYCYYCCSTFKVKSFIWEPILSQQQKLEIFRTVKRDNVKMAKSLLESAENEARKAEESTEYERDNETFMVLEKSRYDEYKNALRKNLDF